MLNTIIGLLMQVLATHTACATEDSNNCYWDASQAGNGVGHSWTSVQVGDVACISYWEYPADDYCEDLSQ